MVPELYALFRYVATGSARKPVESQTSGLIEEKKDTEEKMDPSVDESELRLAQLQHQLPSNEPGTLMQLLEDSNTNDDDDDEDPDTKECRTLFKSLKFFLSREVCFFNCVTRFSLFRITYSMSCNGNFLFSDFMAI